MKPKIGLKDSARRGVAQLLGVTLADEVVLQTKTRNYHWHVTGPQFNDLHKFFESQYDTLDEAIDDTAERIRALGEAAPATLGEFLKLARLQEKAGQSLTAEEMVASLLADHEAMVVALREDLEKCNTKFGDAGNQDFLTGLMQTHEKMAWMLRSMLEK